MVERFRGLLGFLLIVSFVIACSPGAPPAPTATVALPTQAPTAVPPPPTDTAIPTIASTATALPATPTTVPPDTPTPAATATVAAFPVTVTDDANRKVTFDTPPQRIISLSPGLTESLYALGA
ncbi:MAG TPA: hypothetical protein VKT80_13090, partial [Chloroflexota bacterium]|nr:hypothetical protein [Chloroflexota bacterium]